MTLTLSQEAHRVTDQPKPLRRRPLGVTRARQTTQQLTSGREDMRAARAHAEAWYQALRHWETRQQEELVPRTRTGGGSGRMTVIVGNHGRGGATLRFSQVSTPIGWLSESAVATAITQQGGQSGYLGRILQGTTLATLSDPRGGWHQEKASAIDYALEVLALAVQLGDSTAATHLTVLQKSKD